MVMRCQTSVPLPGAKPVIAPSRGYSNHQFTGGYDLRESSGSKFAPSEHKKTPRKVVSFSFAKEQYNGAEM